MARLNVYVPDDLAARARQAELNVSRLTQDAIEAELRRAELNAWLKEVRADPPLKGVSDEAMRRVMEEVKDELGPWPGD
ncbi:type II toxin-antitoxin system CcdA family antitoxin [Nocardioides humi]|uniref:Type II toxin-antitoxin system CcdA family antitoxin n=1 Tax=Nocardioides humi TaxID=449461 RepID=A0ABN2ANQ2_9ACTN|nr:type II toxin-antitoxin system CcdA family antitoxin [Nocardioides humi]